MKLNAFFSQSRRSRLEVHVIEEGKLKRIGQHTSWLSSLSFLFTWFYRLFTPICNSCEEISDAFQACHARNYLPVCYFDAFCLYNDTV